MGTADIELFNNALEALTKECWISAKCKINLAELGALYISSYTCWNSLKARPKTKVWGLIRYLMHFTKVFYLTDKEMASVAEISTSAIYNSFNEIYYMFEGTDLDMAKQRKESTYSDLWRIRCKMLRSIEMLQKNEIITEGGYDRLKIKLPKALNLSIHIEHDVLKTLKTDLKERYIAWAMIMHLISYRPNILLNKEHLSRKQCLDYLTLQEIQAAISTTLKGVNII